MVEEETSTRLTCSDLVNWSNKEGVDREGRQRENLLVGTPFVLPCWPLLPRRYLSVDNKQEQETVRLSGSPKLEIGFIVNYPCGLIIFYPYP